MQTKWFTIGIGIKRWILLAIIGIVFMSSGLAIIFVDLLPDSSLPSGTIGGITPLLGGFILICVASWKLLTNFLAPYRRHQQMPIIDIVYEHSKRHKGAQVVAIGGGTGLPSILRGLKAYTSNITAVVTVADDGGSSGKLRRSLGVLPPGDMRNNIAALANDESLMTKLFQYRFDDGELGGHAFGNLFIAALAGISGGVETALVEIGRVLNIQGRVLPATLDDVNLIATVRPKGKSNSLRVQGESKISELEGRIEEIGLNPPDVAAYEESVQAILNADLIVIGPGSLYTSILPNLMVKGIANALRKTNAYKVYICNVATQPGETEGYTVADHVLVIEQHLGRGVIQIILANNAKPTLNKGENTHYVDTVPDEHEISQRYEVQYTDLTDPERPWRHDSQKLSQALLKIMERERMGGMKNV